MTSIAAAHFDSPEDFSHDGDGFQIGMAPNRIDVLQHISGVDFELAWPNRVLADFGTVKDVPVISVEDLIRNKESAGPTKTLRTWKK